MDLGEAFLGGAHQSDEWAMNEVQRRELMMRAMSKYKPGGAPGSFDLYARDNAGSSTPSPLQAPAPQQTREVTQMQQAMPPPVQPQQAQFDPNLGPPPEAQPQGPQRFSPMERQLGPPMAQQAPEPPPEAAYGLPQDPGQGVPQRQVDPLQAQQLRAFIKQQASKPGGGVLAYRDLLNKGLSPKQVQQYLGFGAYDPAIDEALASQGPVSFPDYATGTDTADQEQAKALTLGREKYGERAISPMVEQYYPPTPTDQRQGIAQYGSEWDSTQAKRTGGAGSLKQFKDPVSQDLANKLRLFQGLGPQIVNAPEYQDTLAQSDLRSAVMGLWGQPNQTQLLQQTLAAEPTLAATAAKYPRLLAFPAYAPVQGASNSQPAQGAPAPPVVTPQGAAKTKAVAQTITEQDVRNQLPRIDPAMAADIRHALDVEKKTPADILAIPAMKQAIMNAKYASKKRK